MSEGELLQIEKARKLDIDEAIYFEIIRKKTASLISSCCGVGASSVGANDETVKKMRTFGELLGIAFQIKDDLFDYQLSNRSGKPSGIDIKEQKMTLPLIYALNNSSSSDKRFMMTVVKRHNKNRKKVEKVMVMVKDLGGIEYAKKRMMAYQKEAIDLLQDFPDSKAKTSLMELADYVISRSK
jgi:octaprenyl-diphosphate synthase